MNADFISVNGKIQKASTPAIAVSDQAFMFGWGVFETIRIYNSLPFMLTEHLERLRYAAEKLEIHFSGEACSLEKHVFDFIQQAELKEGVIRITLSKGVNDQSVLVITSRPVNYHPEEYQKGFTMKSSAIRKNPSSPLTYLKTVNYLDNILARKEAQREGFDEALLLNTENNLCEGSMSNVFFVKSGKIFTPAAECGLLEGISRKFLMDNLIHFSGIELELGKFELMDLYSADEVFITNSVLQIMPVVRVDYIAIGDGIPGRITNSLMRAYESFISSI